MGRMSDIDLETRRQLDEYAEQLELTGYEKDEYIERNYNRIANIIMEKLASAARLT